MQVAAALTARCKAFLINDEALRWVTELRILVVGELVLQGVIHKISVFHRVWRFTCGMASKMVKFCDQDSLDNLTSEVSTHSQNLLILGCSQRKRSQSELLRAIARYDD